MKPTSKIIFLLFGVMGMASCSSYVKTDYYLINTEPAVGRRPNPFPLTVKINNIRFPARYRDQIVYRTSAYELGYYEYSHWAEPPGEMIKNTLGNALRESELFERVDSLGLAPSPDLILQGEIVRFDQVTSEEGYFADCELNLGIYRGDTQEPLWSDHVRATVRQPGEGKFAAAMSEAVSQAISAAIADMDRSGAIEEFAEEKAGKASSSGF